MLLPETDSSCFEVAGFKLDVPLLIFLIEGLYGVSFLFPRSIFTTDGFGLSGAWLLVCVFAILTGGTTFFTCCDG